MPVDQFAELDQSPLIAAFQVTIAMRGAPTLHDATCAREWQTRPTLSRVAEGPQLQEVCDTEHNQALCCVSTVSLSDFRGAPALAAPSFAYITPA